MADDGYGVFAEVRKSRDNRGIVGKHPIAVEFRKVAENSLNVVKRIGTCRVAC